MNRRAVAIIVPLSGIVLIVLPSVVGAPRLLLWNNSASVPIGLYAVLPPRVLHVGDVAVVVPPDPLAAALAARGSLPSGVPLIKPIAALAGQTICRHGLHITIDGAVVGAARARDHRGRPLPAWMGCRTLGSHDVFLMNPAAPDSFVGRATPLWVPKEY